MDQNSALENTDRTFVLGVWWVEFTDGSQSTVSCFRKQPSIWAYVESWVNQAGFNQGFKSTEILGTDNPEEMIDYVNRLVDAEIEDGGVKYVLSFQPQSDALDVYKRIREIFQAFGISISAS